MSNGPLTLRAWPLILLAFVTAPVVVATALWLNLAIDHLANRASPPGYSMWMLFVLSAEIAGVQLELFIAGSFILIFMFVRGRYFSTLVILLIGLLAGIGLYLYPLAILALNDLPTGFSFTDILQGGVIGFLTAGTFRLIAFRPASLAVSAERPAPTT